MNAFKHDKMSEDNNGNRNSIKPLPSKDIINGNSRKKINFGKSRIRGEKGMVIEPVNNINIPIFGKGYDKSIIKKKTIDKKDTYYFGIKK